MHIRSHQSLERNKVCEAETALCIWVLYLPHFVHNLAPLHVPQLSRAQQIEEACVEQTEESGPIRYTVKQPVSRYTFVPKDSIDHAHEHGMYGFPGQLRSFPGISAPKRVARAAGLSDETVMSKAVATFKRLSCNICTLVPSQCDRVVLTHPANYPLPSLAALQDSWLDGSKQPLSHGEGTSVQMLEGQALKCCHCKLSKKQIITCPAMSETACFPDMLSSL